MYVTAVAGCGEVFYSVDSGTADPPAFFTPVRPKYSDRGWPAFISGNSPANGGNMRVSVALRPTD